MNIQKMHIAVQQGVDKINSLQADSLLSQEIDLELNKSIMRFVNLKYGKNNLYRQGFEQSQKRIDDLRSLVSSSEEYVHFKERRILSNPSAVSGQFDVLFVDKYTLPTNYLYHINSYCNVLQNPGCRRDIRFNLETRKEQRVVFTFQLQDLKITENRPGAPEINYFRGWIPTINIIGGATSNTENGQIDFANVTTINEIGGKSIFNRNLWNLNLSNQTPNQYGYVDGYWTHLPMGTDSMHFQTNPNINSGFRVISNYNPPFTTTYGDTWQVSSNIRINKHYTSVIPDMEASVWSREQKVIDSILQVGEVNPGVDIFYENYNGEYQEGTFTVELDPDSWNFLITHEQASQLAETLVSEGKSVDLATGAILSDTTGSQNPNDFTSYISIPLDTEYYATFNITTTNTSDGGLIGAPNEIEIVAGPNGFEEFPASGLTELAASEYWELYQQEQSVQDAMQLANIENFNSGEIDVRRSTAADYFTFNPSGNKRWAASNNWTMSQSLYSSLQGIGEDFPGISKPIKYIQHDDILGLLYDPFNKPTDNRILGVFDSNSILVYTLIKNVTEESMDLVSILPYSIKLKYLRKPVFVNYSSNTSCDLPQHTHEEIVAMTVSSILEGISDPRYKSYMGELMKNE
tara:strand:+ start:13183 stop:15081 length:1899 start_codon:yes stop_codon:yes gene_type:complete